MENKLSIRDKLSELKRLRTILGILFEYGGGILIKKIKLGYLVPVKCKIHCLFNPPSDEKCLIKMEEGLTLSPVALREVLEKLGPTFIKFGQILSLRADIVGENTAKELEKLQDKVPVFPYEEAKNIIESEVGNIDRIFKSLDKKPIASASLAQVYRATLMTGEEVAVKVQRPNIHKIITQDIRLLLNLAGLLEEHVPESRPYQPVKVVKEFADWTIRELDFRAEGHNAERFSFSFKDNPYIKIPKIYWDYTSQRVLTMEFVHGMKADDIKMMKRLKLNRQEIANHGVDALLQQFLIDGFFHADPHPGNFFVLKNGVLCLHDFGMVGYLDETQRKELVSCFIAFTDKDVESFIKHFMHLAILNDASDEEGFKKDVANLLNELFYSSKQPSMAWVFFKAINGGAKRNISFPADLVLFGKAIITSESMGLKIDPGFDFNERFRPFISRVWKEYLNPRKLLKKLKNDFFDYQEAIKNLPLNVQKVLERLSNPEIGVKLDASGLRSLKKEFDRENDLRITGLILTALLVVIIGISYFEGKKLFLGISLNNYLVAAFLGIFGWFLFKLKEKPKE